MHTTPSTAPETGVEHAASESPPAPEVGVAIVTYNSAEHIPDLLSTLSGALEGIPHRVVVADNDSADDSVRLLDDAGIEVVRMGGNLGYSAGLNAGLRRLSDARAVLILNSDMKLGPGSIQALLGALEDPRVGIVAPQTRSFAGSLGLSQRRDPTLLRAFGASLLGGRYSRRWAALSDFVADEQSYLHACNIDWGVGSMLLVRRECIEAVGEWDESFFLYSEEIDYCQRARRMGFLVRYEPSAVVYHEGGGGVQNPRLRSMMVVNKVRLYHRHHGTVRSFLYWVAEMLNESTRGLGGNRAARAAAVSLLVPSRRPPEISCSTSLLPR
ncbi:MAG: glycosyltransferase family 2 protein [Planctomycetes bacterium]|nr:glycosyltransferase family 2 protein [Planctomycetota bacterium]